MADPVTSPVRSLSHETPAPPQPGIALCLSGGGYRAMLFHLGALWRLNEMGILSTVARISSVSGGSITAGVLGLAWRRLGFAGGVATAFVQEVVTPIRAMADHTIDIPDVLKGVFLPGTVAERVAGSYRKRLFGSKTLQDLPDTPRFVFNATNLQSGVLWRFSRPYSWDYRVGKIANPTTELAVAVGASSAFPPVLSPVHLRFRDSDFVPGSGLDLQQPQYTHDVYLADGGVYDNLGLETAWKRYDTILVSDGGMKIAPDPSPHTDWVRQSLRVFDLVDSQVRALRKRQVVGSFVLGDRKGTYWGIAGHLADYHVDHPLPVPADATPALATYPTRLAEVPPNTQECLIDWGYAICDAAMRKHVIPDAPPPAFPYPNAFST